MNASLSRAEFGVVNASLLGVGVALNEGVEWQVRVLNRCCLQGRVKKGRGHFSPSGEGGKKGG